MLFQVEPPLNQTKTKNRTKRTTQKAKHVWFFQPFVVPPKLKKQQQQRKNEYLNTF